MHWTPIMEIYGKQFAGLGYNAYNENLFEVANGVGYSGDIGTLMGRAMDGNIGYGQRGFGGTYVSTNAYYFLFIR